MTIWYAQKIHPLYFIWPNYAHSEVELSFPPKFIRKWSTDVVLENVRLFRWLCKLARVAMVALAFPTFLSRLPWLFGKHPLQKNHPPTPGVFLLCVSGLNPTTYMSQDIFHIIRIRGLRWWWFAGGKFHSWFIRGANLGMRPLHGTNISHLGEVQKIIDSKVPTW